MIARFRGEARRCRKVAFGMQPSVAKAALERLALRWDVIARAEAAALPANDA
jgi:hypothetical protein